MSWTKTPPTRTGAYWLKLENKTPRPVEIYHSRGRIMAHGLQIHDLAESLEGEWLGPLVPVDEVEKAYREGHQDAGGFPTSNEFNRSRARKIVEGELV